MLGRHRQDSVKKTQGHTCWEHGHTADVSEDANMTTHTHTHALIQWHDAEKILKKGRLTLWGNWIFIKYLWMSSSEWREESMPCKDWWKKKRRAGENTKQMCWEMPVGGWNGKRKGHQTKQRSHGNKSIWTADQREVGRGAKRRA